MAAGHFPFSSTTWTMALYLVKGTSGVLRLMSASALAWVLNSVCRRFFRAELIWEPSVRSS